MKKRIIFGLVATFLCLCLFGCGGKNEFGKDNNEINVLKDLKVQDSIIEEFQKDKYDFTEFQGLVEKEIADFNTEHGEDSIVVDTLKMDKDNAIVQMTYTSASIFMEYHEGEPEEKGGTALTVGYLKDADPALLSGEFVNENGDSVKVSELASGNGADYRYVYCDFETYLYGEGHIVAYTKGISFDKGSGRLTLNKGDKVLAVYKD